MTPEPLGFLRIEGAELLLSVRLTPRGGRDGIEGVKRLSDGRNVLAARVRALPESGAANAALASLLSKELDVPAGAVAIVGGATSRLKTIRIRAAYQDVRQRMVHRGWVPQG
ncbi:MAG: hypothetical protein CTY25_13110 [Methylobacterium sp.]|nr:MAG: hypothetical protein CTY25_13110 [Methylobacterium sp.]